MFDIQDYRKLQAASGKDGKGDRQINDVTTMMERAHQAAVHADALMADPTWAMYQQLIAGTIEKLGEQELYLRDCLCDPARADPIDLTRLKLALMQVIGMRTGLETALSLPRALMDDAAKAEDMLEKLLDNHGVEQPQET